MPEPERSVPLPRTRAARHAPPRWIRRTSLGVALLFTWSFVLATPIAALAQQPAVKKPTALPFLKPHDDPAWHTIDYHARSNASGRLPRLMPRLTLLDPVGRLSAPVSEAQVSGWRHELRSSQMPALRVAHLRLWLGEYLLAYNRNPEAAIAQFKQVEKTTRPATAEYGLAAYDIATALFYAGAYQQAADAFHHLLTTPALRHGFDTRTCALWLKHAGACAGFHAERFRMGIPEPPRLDPLCGAAALAACLRGQGAPSSKKRVLAACHVTGEGSSLQDVLDAGKTLGFVAKAVTADDKGLIALPKPLVAYVERDHFIAVVKADQKGVSYLCSDCGPWPGGQVNLSWKQWHALEATVYGVICRPGSAMEQTLSQLAQPEQDKGVQVASASPLAFLHLASRHRRLSLSGMSGHIKLFLSFPFNVICGGKNDSQHCGPQCCPSDWGGFGPTDAFGASAGDPVNLATGEEEYHCGDLTVYNSLGPSVVWRRFYNSLRSPYEPGYQSTDFGVGWSQPYNIGVRDTALVAQGPYGVQPNNTPKAQWYLVEPNGANVQITPATTTPPSASTPKIACTVPAGYALLAEWDYDPATGGNFFTITLPDRTKWITADKTTSTGIDWYPLGQIVDRNSNAITLNYTSPANGYPLLTSITDKNNQALMTLNRSTNGTLSSVQDRYGRSIYYHVGSYSLLSGSNAFGSWSEVDHVSQIVPTGTQNPPDRYAYGYQNVLNGDPNNAQESVPFLHTLTVPSPTGTGTATAAINYQANTNFVSSLVDANGNTHTYTAVDQNHTKVKITDKNNTLAYSYTAGFDQNMSATTRTDGNGIIVSSKTYADPNAPYRPSQVQDGNGYAAGGAGDKGTWNYTWDRFGNCLTVETPYQTTTTNTYTYTNFALGERTKLVEGTKSPVTASYYEPSGLVHTITTPKPDTISGTQTVTTTAVWDALGNLTSVTRPGNNATIMGSVDQGITTMLNYTTDGSYSQPEALGQPIAITDNLGKTTHLRYFNHAQNANDPLANTGKLKSVIDANGNEIDRSYILTNQLKQVTYPATGQSGAGQGDIQFSYLYPGGPLTNEAVYDESSNLIRHLSPSYGLEGEWLTAAGNWNPVTVSRYDALYRTLQLTDGNQHTTQYQYSTAGYLSQLTYPNGDTLQITAFDNDGNPTTVNNGRGTAISYTYNDPDSRLTDVSLLTAHMEYDGYGRLKSISDLYTDKTLSYDDDDLLQGQSVTFVTPNVTASLGYTHYNDGSRDSLSAPSGSFGYSYNGRGELTGISNPFGESFAWSYFDNGWEQSRQVGSAALTQYTYNALGQLTDLLNKTVSNGTRLSELSAAGSGHYDGAGNLLGVTATVPAVGSYSGTISYGYDSKSQLQQESSTRLGSYSDNYVYDPAGNPTTFRNQAGIGYNAANQNTASNYDGDGNPKSWSGQALTWDSFSHLTTIGSTITADNDSSGLRVRKTSASGTTYFLYSGASPICELDSSGNILATNTWGADGLCARHSGPGSGTSVFYTFDHQGSTAQRLNSSGTVLGSYAFDAYGNRQSTDNSTDPYSGFGAQWGYYRDSETGLSLLGARYYDPSQGRFLNRDPIGYAGGINVYAYVGNNSLRGIDPSGKQEQEPSGGEDDVDDNSWSQVPDDPCPEGIGNDPTAGGEPVAAPSIDMAAPTLGGDSGSAGETGPIRFQDPVGAPSSGDDSSGNASGPIPFQSPPWDSRVPSRMLTDGGPAHNFPVMADEPTLTTGQVTIDNPDYRQYELPGNMNGKNGNFEIGGTPNPNGGLSDIIHRFFRPVR